MSDPTTPRSAVDVLREALAYVDSWLEYRVWKLQTPGAQEAVWFDGEIQFSTAYGVSNIETGEPLTTAHLFRLRRCSTLGAAMHSHMCFRKTGSVPR